MKKHYFLFIIVLMLASCTPTVYQETTPTFRVGVPVESESNALIAAQSGLRTSFDYIEPLTVVRVEQMSFGEFSKFVGASSNSPTDMQVWLIIYLDDQWQIGPRPMGTPPPPFHGCVYVAINAADGLPVEVSGPVYLGITECDQ
ncbi:MAG TPA: hypothetical protein VII93_15635 [Anaerolineales bacterium]